MGDWFQTVGDVEATREEAPALAATGLSWLVAAGVVAAEPHESCVLGKGPGYPPGPRYAEAVTAPDERLALLWTNGMRVSTCRTVFDFGQDEIRHAGCPRCGAVARFVDEERECGDPLRCDAAAWQPFDAAIRQWFEGGDGLLACPGCAAPVGLNDWHWEPVWGFGHLAFHFWNWPTLRPEFVAEFARRLGHRVVCVSGKL
jgi:hypothetical protein